MGKRTESKTDPSASAVLGAAPSGLPVTILINKPFYENILNTNNPFAREVDSF